tara:strand:- start:210702 stop:211817 length:1116 start_codon:yes stop_codon:yes gene_type:complete
LLAESNKDIKIAVVGCGNWGKNLIRVLHKMGNLHSICDKSIERAKEFSQTFEVPHLSFDEIIKDQTISGVLVASPSATHYEYTRRCLIAGKNTFVEKPLALAIDNACELYKLAKENDCILMVGHLLQYHLAFNALKQLNNNGTLGKLQYICSNRLNLGKFRTEENIWWDYAPHDVSMILSLTKEMPEHVSAMGSNFLEHTVADITSTHLNFPSGVQAHIFVSWLHPFKEQKLVVVGEKAMAIFDDCADWSEKLKLYPYPVEWIDGQPQPCDPKPQTIALSPQEPLLNECQHFVDCIAKHKTPITDAYEGLQVMRILNAAIQSIETHQTVKLAPEPPTHDQNDKLHDSIREHVNKALEGLEHPFAKSAAPID